MTRPSFAGGQTKEVKKQKNNWKRIEGTFEKCWKIVWAPLVRPLISREVRREVFFFFFSFFSNDENGRWQGSVTHPRCSSVYTQSTQYVKADVVYNRGSLSEAQSQGYIAAIQRLYGVRVAELLSCELFGLHSTSWGHSIHTVTFSLDIDTSSYMGGLASATHVIGWRL
jgi:hypothetical protein